jgi:hypothetical protein
VDFTKKNVTKCDNMWMISAYIWIYDIYIYYNISCEWSPYLLFFFKTQHDITWWLKFQRSWFFV